MNVLSWNVREPFRCYTPIERIEHQYRFLDETAGCPDIIALNEDNRFRREMWLDEPGISGIWTSFIRSIEQRNLESAMFHRIKTATT